MPARQNRDAAASGRCRHPRGWATRNNLAGEARETQRVFRRQCGSSEPHRVGTNKLGLQEHESAQVVLGAGSFVIQLLRTASARIRGTDTITKAKTLIRN